MFSLELISLEICKWKSGFMQTIFFTSRDLQNKLWFLKRFFTQPFIHENSSDMKMFSSEDPFAKVYPRENFRDASFAKV